jgi:hypothetical protein
LSCRVKHKDLRWKKKLRPSLPEHNLRKLPAARKQQHDAAQEVAGPSRQYPAAATEQAINQGSPAGGQKHKQTDGPSHYYGISF